jgi:glycosyltransferase involved in cell wall biosynthesis
MPQISSDPRPKAVGHANLLVISSVLPRPTSAGEIILHRHLSGLTDWTVQVRPHPHEATPRSTIVKLLKRLERTRFHRWGNDLEVMANGHSWSKASDPAALPNSSTVVLTVAHGDGCWAAQRFARQHQLPLVTIFHDWWPDIPAVHAPIRALLAVRFQQLYRRSALALCVSEAMQQQLGPHPNSQVLYPIPAKPPPSSAASAPVDPAQPLRVVYLGGLYDYGPMLAELLQVAKEHPSVHVQVRGAAPNWPAEFREEMRQRGLWLDFAPRSELEDWLASADAFLVTMSFDSVLRRRMETSFSSKLTEYAQFGKPLVIWGPDYCSAVQWAKEGDDRALCVTEAPPLALVAALEGLRHNPDKFNHYAAQARQAAAQAFNPATLQQQFLSAINRLICSQKHVQ